METRVYIVVLRTIDLKDGAKLCMTSGRIASHSAHVAAMLERKSWLDIANQDLIILSVPGSKDLAQVCLDLNAEGISFVEYRDTDRLFEGEHLTAVATYPVLRNQSKSLNRLKPWRCKCNETETLHAG